MEPGNRVHGLLKMFLNAHSGFSREDLQWYLDLYAFVINPPLQRQELSIIERGKAYRTLLGAKSRQGMRTDLMRTTSGENQPKYSARALVAEFFGVTEYEIRKAAKLTNLIPELATIIENTPKQLNLACADIIADYDAASQQAFIEICSIEGYQIKEEPT